MVYKRSKNFIAQHRYHRSNNQERQITQQNQYMQWLNCSPHTSMNSCGETIFYIRSCSRICSSPYKIFYL